MAMPIREVNKKKRTKSNVKTFGHHKYWLWDTATTMEEAYHKAYKARGLGFYWRVFKMRHHPETQYLIYVSERKRKRGR